MGIALRAKNFWSGKWRHINPDTHQTACYGNSNPNAAACYGDANTDEAARYSNANANKTAYNGDSYSDTGWNFGKRNLVFI